MMLRQVEKYIREHHMLESGDSVIVALSGGADSVCLLSILYELKTVFKLQLYAVHLNHGLRGAEADRDEKFSHRLCEKWNISFRSEHRDVAAFAASKGISEEEAGRILRYELFEQEAAQHNAKIAVAHHQDDDAETILYHLFRGSGLKGLSGIKPIRGRIIRPLLCVNKQQILDYLEQEHLQYCTDSTNLSQDYARNRIRNQLLPYVSEQINAKAAQHILSAGKMIGRADAYLNGVAERILEQICKYSDDKTITVQAGELAKEEGIIQDYVVLCMLERLRADRKDLTQLHVREISSLLYKKVGTRICLPYGLTAYRDYEELTIGTESLSAPEKISQSVQMSVFPVKKDAEIPVNQYTKWFDYDKIKGMLSVRTRQTGDYISLPDGKRKTVKSYMIDEKIPRNLRDEILLLTEENHVLWIVGYRISEYYKVTEDTTKILEATVNGGTEDGR